ncbi:MAG: hypothetical protein EOM24_12140, partial [Chloroflexia bacterium]|nr:hypothetical protein [Chloroflexia bacterium]
AALLAPPPAPLPVEPTGLPDALLARATHILQTVEAVQAAVRQRQVQGHATGTVGSLTVTTREACQALPQPISLSQYYTYRQLYQLHGADRARLAAALHRTTYQKTRLAPNTQHFVDTLIRRFFRSNPPLRVETLYRLARQLWQHNRHWWLIPDRVAPADQEALIDQLLDVRRGVDPLLADPLLAPSLAPMQLASRAAFYRYLRWWTAQPEGGADVYIARHGRADWEANFLLFDRFVQQASLPLQYVCADHYRLDILHVDDVFREALPRLWLTLLVDAYSRAVVGLFLSYDDPCIESIQGALRHAIWPKTALSDHGVTLPWACFGIPQRLSLDNAWAHQSHSLEDLTRALSEGGRYTQMELLLRPPYQARYGALVERLFGNLAGQLRELLPGAILRPDQRHWHNASQGACLLYRDVVRILTQLLVTYLHTPHRELAGQTPHAQWLAGLQQMMPVPPPLTPHLARCFWRLHPQTRQASREGVAVFGLHYWDPALQHLRTPDRQGKPRQIQLRYDPLDVSRIAVFEAGRWVGDAFARELRLPDGQFEPVSLWELELAKGLARQQQARGEGQSQAWLLTLFEARELVAQRQAEQKRIRRKLEQLRTQRPGRPAGDRMAEREALAAAQWQASQEALTRLSTTDDPGTRVLEQLEEVL